MSQIVLASGSPRRQELLRRMGITDFTVQVPEVEEYFPAGLTPEETVCYISREKSQLLPCLDRRSGQNDAADFFISKCSDRHRHCKVCLTGSCRSDTKDDHFFADLLYVILLS